MPTSTAVPPTPLHRWREPFLFAALPLLVGQLPGALVFALNPGFAGEIEMTAVPVPVWVFVVVWTIIYPCMGIAAWQLWRQRSARDTDVWVPLAVLTAGFLQTKLFWLSDSLQAVAVADVTGVLLASTTFWVFTRYSRTAAYWLLPWAIWMPITLAIKIVVLAGAAPA